MVETYRTFVAVELPRALRAKLIEHIATLRRELPDARASWSREDSLHLTLKFLGNIPVAEIPKLSEAIARAVNGNKQFELTVAGCGVFPPKGWPNVLWIGVSPSGHSTPDVFDRGFSRDPTPHTQHPEFSRPPTPDTRHPLFLLRSAIERECEHGGFAREPRPYHPHLTIARLRQSDGGRQLARLHQETGFDPVTVSVKDVCLIRSELSNAGACYTIIARHKLA